MSLRNIEDSCLFGVTFGQPAASSRAMAMAFVQRLRPLRQLHSRRPSCDRCCVVTFGGAHIEVRAKAGRSGDLRGKVSHRCLGGSVLWPLLVPRRGQGTLVSWFMLDAAAKTFHVRFCLPFMASPIWIVLPTSLARRGLESPVVSLKFQREEGVRGPSGQAVPEHCRPQAAETQQSHCQALEENSAKHPDLRHPPSHMELPANLRELTFNVPLQSFRTVSTRWMCPLFLCSMFRRVSRCGSVRHQNHACCVTVFYQARCRR